MSAAMYPAVFDDFETFRQSYGPVDKLSTKVFLTGLDNAEQTDVSCQSSNASMPVPQK